MSAPIDYQPVGPAAVDRRRRQWHRVNRWLMVIAGVVLLGGFMIGVEICTDMAWVDARSGSYQTQTIWTFGYHGPLRESQSAFAKRLTSLGITWQPDWRRVAGTSRNIYGLSLSYACGSAPPAYGLIRIDVRNLTDDEIRQMNTILAGHHPQIGDDEDLQKRAINDLLDAPLNR